MRAFLERLRSPGQKASNEAGPPDRNVIVGLLLGSLIILQFAAPIAIVIGTAIMAVVLR